MRILTPFPRRCRFTHSPLRQDDDLLLTPSGVRDLVAARDAHPGRLLGFFGRGWGGDGPPRYDYREAPPGEAPVALTVALLTDRAGCAATAAAAPLMEDIASNAAPRWNGEDIWNSLVSTKRTGRLPLILPSAGAWARLPSWAVSIHTATNSLRAHTAYRDNFLRTAIQRLDLSY